MLVEVVDVLDHAPVHRARHGDVVEHREVLHRLAQADAAGVRAHGHAELRGEQQVGDVLVDAADPGGVDLHDVHAARLEQLLEHDAVLHVLAGRDAHRGDAPRDGGVPEDVVGAGRLLDPRGLELGERVHPRDGVRHVPALVRVDGDREAGSDRATCDAEPAPVVVEVGPDLELDLREPVGHGLAAEPLELLVGVAEPAGRGRVGGVPGLEEPGGALDAAGFGGTQDRERLVGRDGVAQVAEVDERHELLGAEPREVLPQREPGALGPQVPQRVDDRPDRHVHDALLRAEPAQLRVVHESSRRGAHVGEERLDVLPERGGRGASRGRRPATSLPRPMVKTKAWPSSPSPASVRTTT